MKYLMSFVYTFISIVVLSLIITTLNYFNVTSLNTIKYFELSSIVISILIGSIYLGRRSQSKGYLEGLKIGFIIIIATLIINLLIIKNKFSFEIIIYYLIILVSSMLGSIVGINKKLK